MLIKCVECGKEISDKSEACPNCGCPTSESITNIGDLGKNNLKTLNYTCPNCGNNKYLSVDKPNGEIAIICNNCGYVKDLINDNQQIQRQQFLQNQPKCPTCGSTNIEKLSFTKKAISIGGLGILSNKIGKTYQCKNCKATW